jgi:hypothetical protein
MDTIEHVDQLKNTHIRTQRKTEHGYVDQPDMLTNRIYTQQHQQYIPTTATVSQHTNLSMSKDSIMNIKHLFLNQPGLFNRCHREELLDAFGIWIKQHQKEGWNAYLFTFMFNQLPGSQEAQRQQMHDEVSGVYSKLVTRMVRKPKSPKAADLLPRGVFFLDKPIAKRQKSSLRDASVNDGLHMHGIVVSPQTSRLKVGLLEHFTQYRLLYQTPKLYRIEVEPIDHSPVYVTNYAGKALKSPSLV